MTLRKIVVLEYFEDREARGIHPTTRDLAARYRVTEKAAERHLRSLHAEHLIEPLRVEPLWRDVRFQLTDRGRARLAWHRGQSTGSIELE